MMHVWFLVTLSLLRVTHVAIVALRLRKFLPAFATAPAIAAVIHFGCWAGDCPWPFLRFPHTLEPWETSSYFQFWGQHWLQVISTEVIVIATFDCHADHVSNRLCLALLPGIDCH
jgi:hypothetical protein